MLSASIIWANRKIIKGVSQEIPNEPLLRFTFTPAEYEAFIPARTGQDGIFNPIAAGRDYLERLPRYLVARCPLCGAESLEPLDTHGLHGWYPMAERDQTVFLSRPTPGLVQRCQHFVAVQTFVNLNGHKPTEVHYYTSDLSDIPYVTAGLLLPDLPTYAVMHSLPICRVERNHFVPRYSAYTITYYAAEPASVRRRRRAALASIKVDVDSRLPFLTLYPTQEEQDLKHWVTQGQLQWLDATIDSLPLCEKSAKAFPYLNIAGIGKPAAYKQGSLD